MFKEKQKSLLNKSTKTVKAPSNTTNPFINAGLKKAARTVSGNGAKKFTSTANEFVNQFGVLGSYKQPRTFDEISKDVSTLWGLNPLVAMKFIVYLRIITRVVQTFLPSGKTSVPQRGAGLKHESIMRMIWVAINHPVTFWKNITLFIAAGSWKDVIQMMSYDIQYNGWNNRLLDWDRFANLILAGLENPATSEMIKKYLPQIKSNSVCNTIESQADNIIAKFICSKLFGSKMEDYKTYKQYRKLKSSGTAHEWQKLISQKKLLKINFSTIHGRALAQLVSSKFLTNNKLEEVYNDWLEKQPTIKYTGYPHELFKNIGNIKKLYEINTLNKQFDGLVKTAKEGASTSTSFIVVRDTSGSMGATATGTTMSCFDIGKALALFFSKMLPTGNFANSFIEFNSDAKMHRWSGKTAYENWKNDHTSFVGSTNFQSVIELFSKIKKTGVKEEEFPTGILCISDSEFDPVQLGKTNVKGALDNLKSCGFSEEYVNNFKIVLWNLQSSYYGSSTGKKFETFDETENVFYFSGYEPSVIAFLTGIKKSEKDEVSSAPKTDVELFEAAMDQELLDLVTL
jgi:hypothetical protein